MVGYFPAFKGLEAGLATTAIDHYTHLNIAFANPDRDGLLVRDGGMTCMSGGAAGNVTLVELRQAVTRLRARGAKVLLSVGGGSIPSCSGDWAALLGPGKREALAAELAGVVDAAGLDGIDIDIEGELLTAIDRAGDYTPFVAALSAALKARGKLLTVATASYEGGMIPVSSIRYFDLVMPMSYDAIGPSGVPAERLALGVPFYGYGFGKYAPGGDFRSLLAAHGDTVLTSDVIGSACAGCDYLTFNAQATIRRKAELARARAGGIMVWEVTQDTDDQLLGRTIAAALAAPSN